MGLVLSGGNLIKIAKSHMRSTCRKLKSQVPTVEVEESCASCASCFCDSGDPRVTREFHWLEDLKCDFLTLHPYYKTYKMIIEIHHKPK